MKLPTFVKAGYLSAVIVAVIATAYAQVPLPTARPVSSEVRQKLRAAILEVATSPDPNVDNARSELALPLAQVGDWNGALRLVRNDFNAPVRSDELWQWRAYQLARAGKWREVPIAAANIKRLAARADALLFAARTMIDRGFVVDAPVAGSSDLKAMLLAAAPLLEKAGTIQQKAYNGYLWARGGDYAAAERVFARTVEAAKRSDRKAREEAKKNPKGYPGLAFSGQSTRDVLLLQARAGLLQSALQHAAEADSFLMGWWLAAARTQADIAAITEVIQKLPLGLRVPSLLHLSMVSSMHGDKVQGRVWFDMARKIEAAMSPQSESERREKSTYVLLSFYAAHFLEDAALQAQTAQELSALEAATPVSKWFIKPEEITVVPLHLDLEKRQLTGYAVAPPSAARLDEITERLKAHAPSDLQFRALEKVATYHFLAKRPDKLLIVAQLMLETARALASAETAEREKKRSMFNPYWPRSPRVLTSVFWLQRAGDQQTAATFAREFARNVPQRERPYAAMSLFQLGFPELADSVYDPKVEIPLAMARQRQDWKSKNIDWSAFMSWDDFAASEARFRAPDAPFRWFDKVEGVYARAGVLRKWVEALYPQTRQTPPYVRVTPRGSSSSF